MASSPSIADAASRYVVGFDLGTTNSAVTYVDTAEEPWQVRDLRRAATGGRRAGRSPRDAAFVPLSARRRRIAADAALKLPWKAANDEPPHVVGFFARDHGAAGRRDG